MGMTAENIAEKRCYTVKEVQEMLGISRPTVYELLKKNEFRWIQIGNKYRISKKSFDEWLDQKSERVFSYSLMLRMYITSWMMGMIRKKIQYPWR